MECKKLGFISNKEHLYYEKYDYIFIDVSSMLIVPYLNLEKYQSTDRINITPFVETVKFYVNMKEVLPKTKFIFVFDGGISINIKKIYPTYKANRKSKRNTGTLDGNTNNLYDYNCMLIKQLFDYLNEIVISSNVINNEADFIIGYLIKNVKKENCKLKNLVVSHDKDYLLMYDENVHVIYKHFTPTVKCNYLIKNFDCISEIINFYYLRNVKELLYYKALMGDISDNIKKPFGITNKTPIENFFTNSCLEDKEISYTSILEYFNNKFKKIDLYNKFEKDFRRNIFLMNVFNEEIILDSDKIKLNKILNEILYPNNNKIEINLIKNFISEFGLYFDEEETNRLFKYLIG